jgi:hypothetical protein
LYLSFDIISRAIKTFDGSQANLRNWLNEVEKFAFINRIDDNAKVLPKTIPVRKVPPKGVHLFCSPYPSL